LNRTIYIRLLEEGSWAYRPVTACRINENIYKVEGHEIHFTDDEVWEFTPGTIVVVEEKKLRGGIVLVAVRAFNLLNIYNM